MRWKAHHVCGENENGVKGASNYESTNTEL